MDTIPVAARADLTDAQWAVLEPLLPKGKKPGRPPKWSKRQLVDGIRWRIRVGSPWRDVPPQYGPWQTVYGLFRRWQRDGTWARVLTGLQAHADAAGLITWDVSVDSTIARAHQHTAGARKRDLQTEPPGGSAGGRAGRPRPGTVRHIIWGERRQQDRCQGVEGARREVPRLPLRMPGRPRGERGGLPVEPGIELGRGGRRRVRVDNGGTLLGRLPLRVGRAPRRNGAR